MDRRFEVRKQEILEEAEMQPQVSDGILKRLKRFIEPFAAKLKRPEPKEHTAVYLAGLLSDLERKNTESIAYRHDQDRQNLQRFIGSAPWDHQPLQQELSQQIGAELGEEDGVIVFDGEFNSQVRHLSPLRREAEVYPIGCLKAQTFSWPGVQAVLNQGDLVLCDPGKRPFLREVLPDQAVGIFV